MWHDLQQLIGQAQNSMLHLDRTEWMAVFTALIVIGTFCLRGFSSRLNY